MRNYLYSTILIFFAQIALTIDAKVFLRECTSITSYGKCFTVVVPTVSRTWNESDLECSNYDQRLASILSEQETGLAVETASNIALWIGLNDIANESVYVWVDGSTLGYTNWAIPYPLGGRHVNCVTIWNGKTSDFTCSNQLAHICSSTGSQLGYQVQGNDYEPLIDGSILSFNTASLLCITEQYNMQQVHWKYVSFNGVSTYLSANTDGRGFSTLNVTLDEPGFYSCNVSQWAGNATKIYTTAIIDLSSVIETDSSYVFTRGIDREDILVFCHEANQSSFEFVWKIQGESTNILNPLSISTVLDEDSDNQQYQCSNPAVQDQTVLDVDIHIQGPPIISIETENVTTFSLLPPIINRIANSTNEIARMSVNIPGRWVTPDGSYSNNNTLFSSNISQSGLYRFYINDWYGTKTLAIQIYLIIETETQMTVTDNAQDILLLSVIAIQLIIISLMLITGIIAVFLLRKRILESA